MKLSTLTNRLLIDRPFKIFKIELDGCHLVNRKLKNTSQIKWGSPDKLGFSTSYESYSSPSLTLLTPQVPEECLQLEASEVSCCGRHRASSVGCRVSSTGQENGTRAYSKEADEDGAQDKHDH